MGNNTYYLNNLHSRPDLTSLVGAMVTMMGNEKDFLATRVAYKLNLKGPAINVSHGLFDVIGGGVSGLPEPAQLSK